ncbi:MAG TPA: pyridoxal phosphate-dependent aminotransferase [Candidatus Acidoferrum sp.]|jgi:aspartate aminotransferase|nr:pyridoxal phosphate-dependent aminotransferase [Candidatus Acidoferrum sp.]
MRSIASRMSVMSGEGALSVYARAKELESQGRSIVHLELGEPDFHPGPSVVESVAKALAEGKDRYCAVAGVPALREEIAVYLQRTRNISVSAANIVIAPGCKAALFFAMMALLEPGDEVLYPDPGFPGYPSITLGLGAVPVPFELSSRKHFQPDLSEVAAKITRRTRMLLTNSPGNPTGTVYTDDVQRGLAELAVEHDLWVLSDEIYARIIYGGEYVSMLRYHGMEARTLIIDGFSKSFAMTGWRLGYTVAPAEVVPALLMMAVNTYTCVNEFIQYAAIEALRDREGTTPLMVAEFARRREQFVHDLNEVPGFRCEAPEGAFYAWVDIRGTGVSADEVCRILLEDAGVAAIPGAAFGPSGEDFVRFSFASSVANLREATTRIMRASAAWQGTLAER